MYVSPPRDIPMLLLCDVNLREYKHKKKRVAILLNQW